MADVYELNAKTREVIVRDYTKDELAQRTKDLAKHAALAEAEVARQVAKSAVLTKLGLSADELAALLGA